MSTRRESDGPAMAVADRYRNWCFAEKDKTQPPEKVAQDLEGFAVDLEAITADEEPYEGWGVGLAALIRRRACRARGEDPGPWPFAGDKPRESPN